MYKIKFCRSYDAGCGYFDADCLGNICRKGDDCQFKGTVDIDSTGFADVKYKTHQAAQLRRIERKLDIIVQNQRDAKQYAAADQLDLVERLNKIMQNIRAK